MILLNKSGNLEQAQELFQKQFVLEEEVEENTWRPIGELTFFSNTAFFNHKKLYHIFYDAKMHRVLFSFGKKENHCSGQLYVDTTSLIGTMQIHETIITVRGRLKEQRYHLLDSYQKHAKELCLQYHWQHNGFIDVLQNKIYLDQVEITKEVNVQINSKTSIVSIQKTSSSSLFQALDFIIDHKQNMVRGSYQSNTDEIWEYTGTIQLQSLVTPKQFYMYDSFDLELVYPKELSKSKRDEHEVNPETSLQDLMNLSSYEVFDDETIDHAQNATHEYFQHCLINSGKEELCNYLNFEKQSIPKEVEGIRNQYIEFFKEYATMNLGQILYTGMNNGPPLFQDLAKHINIEKIDYSWKEAGKTLPFQEINEKLYTEGYRNEVKGIRPYLGYEAKKWADKLYNYVNSARFLSMWRNQLMNPNFSKTRERIQEIHTKLLLLDPSVNGKKRASDTSILLYNSIVVNSAMQVTYNEEESRTFLDALQDTLDTYKDQLEKKNGEKDPENLEFLNYFKKLLNLYGTTGGILKKIKDVLEDLKKLGHTDVVTDNVPLVATDVARNLSTHGVGFDYDKLQHVLKGILFMACIIVAIVLIFKFDTKLTTIEIVSLAATTIKFLIEGFCDLFEKKFLEWSNFEPNECKTFFKKGLRNIGKWVNGKFVLKGNVWLHIFGINAKAFLLTRVVPVLVVLSVLETGFQIMKDIQTGDIVAEVIDLVTVVTGVGEAFSLMFLSCAPIFGSIAAIFAIVGGISIIVKMLYDIFKPKKLEPSPVTRFVGEDLKAAGFAIA